MIFVFTSHTHTIQLHQLVHTDTDCDFYFLLDFANLFSFSLRLFVFLFPFQRNFIDATVAANFSCILFCTCVLCWKNNNNNLVHQNCLRLRLTAATKYCYEHREMCAKRSFFVRTADVYDFVSSLIFCCLLFLPFFWFSLSWTKHWSNWFYGVIITFYYFLPISCVGINIIILNSAWKKKRKRATVHLEHARYFLVIQKSFRLKKTVENVFLY